MTHHLDTCYYLSHYLLGFCLFLFAQSDLLWPQMPHFYPAGWSQEWKTILEKSLDNGHQEPTYPKESSLRARPIPSIKQTAWLSLKHGQWKWSGPALPGSRTVQGFSNFKKTKPDRRAPFGGGKTSQSGWKACSRMERNQRVSFCQPVSDYLCLGYVPPWGTLTSDSSLFPGLSVHSGPLWTQPMLHFINDSRSPLFVWCLPHLIKLFPPVHSAPLWPSSTDPHCWSWFRTSLDDTQGENLPNPWPEEDTSLQVSSTVTTLRFYQTLQADKLVCHSSSDTGWRRKPPRSETKDFITHGTGSTLSFLFTLLPLVPQAPQELHGATWADAVHTVCL